MELAQKLITEETVVFWFRRDLRLEDNAGLYHALRSNSKVLPIFIFDSVILERLEDNKDRRVDFIHQTLKLLKENLEKRGSSLLILYGDPVKIFKQLGPKAVYTNHDYEPYALKRDLEVKNILVSKQIDFFPFKDQVIFEWEEINLFRN